MSLRSYSTPTLAMGAVALALAVQVALYGFFEVTLEPHSLLTAVTWAVVGGVAACVALLSTRDRFALGSAVGVVALALVFLVPLVGYVHHEMDRLPDLLTIWPFVGRTFLALYAPVVVGFPLGVARTRWTQALVLAIAVVGAGALTVDSLLRLGEPSIDPGFAPPVTPFDVVYWDTVRFTTHLLLGAPLFALGRRLRTGRNRESPVRSEPDASV